MRPSWLLTAIGLLAGSLSSAHAETRGRWETRDLQFGWLYPASPEDYFAPFIECVKPGESISVAFPVPDGQSDVRPGKAVTIRASTGSDSVEISGTLNNGADGVDYAGAIIGPSHKLYGLFQGTGALSVQINKGPKQTFNLRTAPAAFAEFETACQLAPSSETALKIAGFLEALIEGSWEGENGKAVVEIKDNVLTSRTWLPSGEARAQHIISADSPCVYRVAMRSVITGYKEGIHTLDFRGIRPDQFRISSDGDYFDLTGVTICHVSGETPSILDKPESCRTHNVYIGNIQEKNKYISYISQAGQRMALLCKK